ncbi:DUF294 nucleotidyltransferase-like domain-containing protein [Aliikangiella coralliicola]|uniref:Cyclic nucleotide-binding/CBS domain-containing protein n=1 Tax=Aliikangiella coralliicola TaxID=2592383 RepID=A0A545UCV7_9GAMM|nr:DUF294 nucleotidyltransferase-like domain-containing protein [Aliikangiella coralliicola]TQV87299.1 cyclic nucleotide-binding/CBS domain-containing protein [Aliikangiella coralliicola]
MEIENLEIFQYLTNCEPISQLDSKTQKKLALSIEIVYFKRGSIILQPGSINQWLYIIRSGAVERTQTDGSIVAQFAEKDIFGQASLKRGGTVERKIQAIEDTLLYRFPKEIFFELIQTNSYVKFYFEGFQTNEQTDNQSNHQSNAVTLDSHVQSADFNRTQVKTLIHEKAQTVDHKISVAECARIMQTTGSTSLLITQNEKVLGIVTDRAFCTKVVAQGLSHESPVGLIMSDNLLTIDAQNSASEALLTMARHNIRHLPVTSHNDILGVLTATDLIHRQSNNPIYLINEIHKAKTLEQLVRHSRQIPKALIQMVKNGHNAKDTSYSISSIGRAINQRLIKLAEEKFGPPPVKYAWIIAGSLARNEQTIHTDQDNGLILDDCYDEDKHGKYFRQLAHFVCDGLNDCGYIYCPGDVMATNKKWRQPLSQWKSYFQQWIVKPEPKALMYASIFFDLRCIYGETSFLMALNKQVNQLIASNKKMLNYMASNALHNTPPLGLFRSFVLEKHGSEEKALNMKKRGVVPITDLARVYALSCEASPINTQERLQTAFDNNALSQSGLMDLCDAFEFLSFIRLCHQAKQVEKGVDANNYLLPEELSSLERRHLKDTFEIIRTYQKALESRYQASLIA